VNERRVPSRVSVPRGMAERAREFAVGGLPPAVPRDAATVILLRQAPGVEAFLLRRARALEFAPGACVFPGGSVDESDADPAVGETGWAGPSPADLGDLLGISPERARALVCAAVRETFEESGVLLAGPSAAELVPGSAMLDQARRSLLDGSASLGDLLRRHGLLLRADLLTPWAHWITPEISPRRFDTWFFAAALPTGQTAGLARGAGRGRGVWGGGQPPQEQGGSGGDRSPRGSAESDSGIWWAPSMALAAARSGEITLLPPTAVTLAELAAYQDVAGILAERKVITAMLPTVVIEDEQVWLAMPQEVEYPL
jgi:8-oxo-dGTP pyrophosphatase MutT (NUDIX family)